MHFLNYIIIYNTNMNIKDIENYKKIKNKTLKSSDVVKSSFTNVLENLSKDNYVLVENQR